MDNKHDVPLFFKGNRKTKPIPIPVKSKGRYLEKENLQSDVDKFRDEIEERDRVNAYGELIDARSLDLQRQAIQNSKNPTTNQIEEKEPPCFGDECIMSGGKMRKTVKRRKHKRTTQKRKKARKNKTAKK